MADNTFTHAFPPSPSLSPPPSAESQATRAHKRLYAPLDCLKTETPAASTEVLYVKARGLFGTGAEGSVYVCHGWRGVGATVEGGEGPPPCLTVML